MKFQLSVVNAALGGVVLVVSDVVLIVVLVVDAALLSALYAAL